jgi:hypothetical protein
VKAEKILKRTGYYQIIVDVAMGRVFGLIMMWKKGIKVTELSVTNQHIDVLIEDGHWSEVEIDRGLWRTKLGHKDRT